MNPINKDNHKILNQIEAYSTASAAIEKLYKTSTGKKFIHHLIDAFSGNEIIYAFYSGKVIYDCLSKSKLRTLFDRSNKLVDKEINGLLKSSVEIEDRTERFKVLMKADELIRERYPNLNTTRVAVISEHSNKILGIEELQALSDFISDRLKAGDKTIRRMVKYYKHNTEDSKVPADQINTTKQIKSNPKKSPVQDEKSYEDKLKGLVTKYKK